MMSRELILPENTSFEALWHELNNAERCSKQHL